MVNIKSLFELKKTAEFYGYYICVYPEIKPCQEYRISLIELGSEIEIGSWSGINAEKIAVEWCNWLFNTFEEENL